MQSTPSEKRLHVLDYWQVVRNHFGIILLTFFLVLATAYAITKVLPKQYLGRAALEIVQDEEDLRVFNGGGGGMHGHNLASMNFIKTEFEVITSQQTLYKVIDELGLVERWNTGNRAGAFKRLHKRTDPSARHNTNLIDIEVYADSPDEAAELANAIADNYSKRRQEDDDARLLKGVTALATQVEKQEEIVDAAQSEMLRLAREFNIAEVAPGYGGRSDDPLTTAPSVLQRSELDLYAHEQEIEKIREQVEQLQGLSGDDLIEQAIALEVADLTVQQLYPQYLIEQKDEQRLLNGGLGRKHPKVKAIQAQLEKSRELLTKSVGSIRDSLQTRLQIAEGSLEKIEQLRDGRKEDAMSERENHGAYVAAKSDYHRQRDVLDTMRERLVTAEIDRKMTSTPIQIHEYAEADPIPAKPNTMLNLALGGLVGLALGLGMAFMIEYLDTSVKSIEDVEGLLDVPVLAVIPKDIGLLMNSEADNLDAEAYRILRTNIEFNRKRGDANAISVVSGSAGEGKSTTLSNLAFVCAQAGYTTLLIDGDLRRPKLHTFFNVSNENGLSAHLAGRSRLEDSVMKSQVENLWFMPSGPMPADPSGLLNSKPMRELMIDLKSRFDVILIDAPPILGVSDGAVLASEADMTIAVVQHRKLPQKTLLRVKQAVESAGGDLLGVVLNNVDIRSDSQYQYYTSYYTYYATPDGGRETGAPSSRPAGSPQSSTSPAASAAAAEPLQQQQEAPSTHQPQQYQPAAQAQLVEESRDYAEPEGQCQVQGQQPPQRRVQPDYQAYAQSQDPGLGQQQHLQAPVQSHAQQPREIVSPSLFDEPLGNHAHSAHAAPAPAPVPAPEYDERQDLY